MKKEPAKKSKYIVEMPLVNPDAAGIDVGDKEHVVALPIGRCEPRVATFGTMTCDLEAIVSWLKENQIQTVAKESTGVYWKPLFSILSKNGFEVSLVNAKNVKNHQSHET